MSEQLKKSHENNNHSQEIDRAASERLKNLELESNKVEHKKDNSEQINKILESVEKSAKKSEDLAKHHQHQKTAQHQKGSIGSQFKKQALKSNLRRIQKELPTWQRPFSKFVHNQTVNQISEVGAETIARPSALLTGGLFSFIASLVVLVICRYYGYEYNYLIGLVALLGGLFLGIIIELTMRLFSRKKTP